MTTASAKRRATVESRRAPRAPQSRPGSLAEDGPCRWYPSPGVSARVLERLPAALGHSGTSVAPVSSEPAPQPVAPCRDAGQEHEDRGNDAHDRRQAESDADCPDECREEHRDQNANHVGLLPLLFPRTRLHGVSTPFVPTASPD